MGTKARKHANILCSYPPHSMLWLNVYEGCLLPTNILSSTSLVSATVPRCPGRGTFLPSLLAGRVWWESRGRSVTASPPQFPAKCGHHRHQATSSPGHMGSGTSAPPPADTSTGAGLQGPRPVFITPCHSSGKEIRCQIFLVLSFMVNNRTSIRTEKTDQENITHPLTGMLY